MVTADGRTIFLIFGAEYSAACCAKTEMLSFNAADVTQAAQQHFSQEEFAVICETLNGGTHHYQPCKGWFALLVGGALVCPLVS